MENAIIDVEPAAKTLSKFLVIFVGTHLDDETPFSLLTTTTTETLSRKPHRSNDPHPD